MKKWRGSFCLLLGLGVSLGSDFGVDLAFATEQASTISSVVEAVPLTGNPDWLQEDGSLSIAGAVGILRWNGLLPDRLFKVDGATPQDAAIEVVEMPRKNKNKFYRIGIGSRYLRDTGFETGSQSGGHYRQKFIIKYFVKAEHVEVENLSVVRQSALARLPFGDLDYPIVSLDEKTFCYHWKEKRHCFTILHSAKGQQIHEILKTALLSKSGVPDLATVLRGFYKIGKAFAKIHLRFAEDPTVPLLEMKTYVHGDAHSENVIFDPEGDRVYLIDNEAFADSIRKSDGISTDVKLFIEWASTLETDTNRKLFEGIYAEFVEGYSSAFPVQRREEIRRVLSELVNNSRMVNSRDPSYGEWLVHPSSGGISVVK